MFRSFFIGLAWKLAQIAEYMMIEMFCAGSTPAAGINAPRRTSILGALRGFFVWND